MAQDVIYLRMENNTRQPKTRFCKNKQFQNELNVKMFYENEDVVTTKLFLSQWHQVFLTNPAPLKRYRTALMRTIGE